MPRITFACHALAQRDGCHQRQLRPEDGQPVVLSLEVSSNFAARQPYRQISPEPVDRVVPAGRLDRPNRQLRPLRELRLKETVNQRNVNVHLGGGPGARR